MPEAVVAKEIHLLQDLFHRPLFIRDTIGGDEDAGAVLAETAMEENFLCRILTEEREELNHLLIRGCGPLIDGDMDETHAQGRNLLPLPEDFCGIFEAKVDHGVDAEFLEFSQTLWPGLRAAVEMIIDSAAVGEREDVKFFSVGGTHFGGRRRITLCGERTRQERGANETEKKERVFHSG